MWLFLPDLFVSIVNKPGDDNLCCRFRHHQDAENFRKRLADSIGTSDAEAKTRWPITAGQGTDYYWRLYATHEDVAKVMSDVTKGIDYGNFKNHVKKITGAKRASAYMQIWSVMMGIQQRVVSQSRLHRR